MNNIMLENIRTFYDNRRLKTPILRILFLLCIYTDAVFKSFLPFHSDMAFKLKSRKTVSRATYYIFLLTISSSPFSTRRSQMKSFGI